MGGGGVGLGKVVVGKWGQLYLNINKNKIKKEINKGIFCYVNKVTFGPYLRIGARC